MIERAASLSAADMAHALQQRNTYYTAMRQFMDLQRFDLLLTPTLPVTAFTAGLDEPDGWQRSTLAPLDWTPFTFPFNLTGQPAATVPCGFDRNGLPVGLQIVGRWRDDSTVLRAAAAFESAMPWTDVRPPLDSPDASRSVTNAPAAAPAASAASTSMTRGPRGSRRTEI